MSAELFQHTRSQIHRAVQLTCQLNAFEQQQNDRERVLLEKVGQAKYRLSFEKEVGEMLQILQLHSNEKGIGLYENLLAMLVREILPEIVLPVKFELVEEGGIPNLYITLGEGDNAEDLWDGNGGSLANVITAGIRFIALVRSPLRRFILMDESDCWLEVDRVGAFASILDQFCNKLGIQMLSVTHHGLHHFSMIKHRVHLKRDPVFGVTVTYPNGVYEWQDDQPGIRAIHLKNFMSHKDSTIHLSPFGNMLSGSNMVGKSAIRSAFMSFSENNSNDTMIRRGENEMRIEFQVEKGQTVGMVRYRKPPKDCSKFAFYLRDEAGEKFEEGRRGAKNIPDFILKALNIFPINGIDIQISHQKKPGAILELTASQKAHLLSLGQEGDYVRQMMKQYRLDLNNDKKQVETSESEILVIRDSNKRIVQIKENLGYQEQAVTDWSAQLDQIEQNERQLEDMQKDFANYQRMLQAETLLSLMSHMDYPDIPQLVEVEDMQNFHQRYQKVCQVEQVLSGLDVLSFPEVPVMESTESMKDFMIQYGKLESKDSILSLMKSINIPEVPVMVDYQEMVQFLGQYQTLEKQSEAMKELEGIQLSELPVMERTEEMLDFVQAWNLLDQKITQDEKNCQDAKLYLDKLSDILDNEISAHGGLCPTCNQVLSLEKLHQ